MEEGASAVAESAQSRSRHPTESTVAVSYSPTTSSHAGLRIVLGVKEMVELVQLRRRVREMEAGAALVADAKLVCPVLSAVPGERFTHHPMLSDQGGYEEDHFEYLGRTGSASKTPPGWLAFRHLEIGRGICAFGCSAGLNGGMRDACGAWPTKEYCHYKPDGTCDEREIALPIEQCWGFRSIEPESESDAEG